MCVALNNLGPIKPFWSSLDTDERTDKTFGIFDILKDLKWVTSIFIGNIGLVRKLLRLGADPNSQDNAGIKFSR